MLRPTYNDLIGALNEGEDDCKGSRVQIFRSDREREACAADHRWGAAARAGGGGQEAAFDRSG